MSILENLFKNILGDEENTSSAERPCTNCPSSCELCPEACDVCKPYKEQLLEAAYQADHIDEIRAKYEVVSDATAKAGTVACPYCGAPSGNAYVCEYCGMQIQTGSEKIRVSSASEIPNPILEAQDIIYNRYEAVVKPRSEKVSSGGLLASLLELVTDSDSGSNPYGNKMTEQEIVSAASSCGVSVGTYLTGLDNGTYLTPSAKKEQEKIQQTRTSNAGMFAGAAGLGGTILGGSSILGGSGSSLFGNGRNNNDSGRRMPPPPPQGQNGSNRNSNQRPSRPEQGMGSMRGPGQNQGSGLFGGSGQNSRSGSPMGTRMNGGPSNNGMRGPGSNQGGRGGRGPSGRNSGGRGGRGPSGR